MTVELRVIAGGFDGWRMVEKAGPVTAVGAKHVPTERNGEEGTRQDGMGKLKRISDQKTVQRRTPLAIR